MDNVEFVKINREDISVLQENARTIWAQCYAAILTPEQIDYMLDMMYSEVVVRREIETEKINYFFVFYAGMKIGFVSFGPYHPSDGWAKLHKIYLFPEFHGRGLGAAALAKVCELASEQGYNSICLNVNKKNSAAIKAYERNGFVKSEEVVNDIGGGYVMDDYVMVKDLSGEK